MRHVVLFDTSICLTKRGFFRQGIHQILILTALMRVGVVAVSKRPLLVRSAILYVSEYPLIAR